MPVRRAVPFALALFITTACGGEAKKAEPEVKAAEPAKPAEDDAIAKRRAER
jgi:hypothetical protein